jgi:peptide/nickel transport system substrate-binding protein
MKLVHLIDKACTCGLLLMIPAILFITGVDLCHAASEPGTVTILLAEEPTTLDPGYSTVSMVGQVMKKNVLESLTEINPDDSSITPRLAQSWKQIDANTWHFFLRRGVKFHDGADFNAEAVVFNIKRLYNKNVYYNARVKYFSGFATEGKAIDSYTVEIKTAKFQPLLPILMGILAISSPNTPADKATRYPIGTGPYKFVKWDAGTQIVLERFDGYWGKQPQVRKAVYLWRSESSVRAAMISIGEADFAPNIAKQDANRPDMDYSYLNSETTYLRGGGLVPPLNDRRVRMALNYAVNRNAIREGILGKDVIPATQLVVPSTFGYNPDLKVWPYDPQRARQLLDEARKDGVPVDKEIALIGRIGHFPNSDELVEALMIMFKDVGLNVKLRILEQGVYRPYMNKPYPPGPYLLLMSHDNNFGDAVITVFSRYHCAGLSSADATCDKKMDDLIEKAQVATGEERRNLWRTVFKRIHEDIVPEVPLFHMVGYCRIGKRISFKPSLATVGEIPLEQMAFK